MDEAEATSQSWISVICQQSEAIGSPNPREHNPEEDENQRPDGTSPESNE